MKRSPIKAAIKLAVEWINQANREAAYCGVPHHTLATRGKTVLLCVSRHSAKSGTEWSVSREILLDILDAYERKVYERFWLVLEEDFTEVLAVFDGAVAVPQILEEEPQRGRRGSGDYYWLNMSARVVAPRAARQKRVVGRGLR